VLTQIRGREGAVIEAVRKAEQEGHLTVLYEELTENCLWLYDPAKCRLVINKAKVNPDIFRPVSQQS
jgi:hypothetical protein